MATRRNFLMGLIAAGAAPAIGWASVGSPSYLAAAREQDGSFAIYGLDQRGNATFRVPLPARGHAGAGHPRRAEAVAFARRPGTYALVIDCAAGEVRHRLTPPEGHHFNGHGVFHDDGRRLLTCEQRADNSQGLIGIWDSASYQRVGEIETAGIGPHDLRLMPDGETLVVANGGIATDPTDRTKLNVDSMQPNLTYLDISGDVLEQVILDPELHQSSIRHLAIRGDGLVAFAMQWEGEVGAATPLLGLHRRGGEVILAEAPLADELAMQGYAGSIAFSGDGAEVAITSPVGGRVHCFGVDGAFHRAVSRGDVCGIASLGAGYLASDGMGGLIAIEGGEPVGLGRMNCAWDNHIVAL